MIAAIKTRGTMIAWKIIKADDRYGSRKRIYEMIKAAVSLPINSQYSVS